MKRTHRGDVWTWSVFDGARNVDFNSWAWVREGGNVLVDPLPLSAHDLAHLESLGGAASVVITNSDHTRGARELAARFGAKLIGPRAEQATFPFPCDRWVGEGDEIVPHLVVLELQGSKTPGELALVLEDSTLICGDLVRGHAGGTLNLLPDAKLADKALALESVRRLLDPPRFEAVLVGDGWPVFRDAHRLLRELVAQ